MKKGENRVGAFISSKLNLCTLNSVYIEKKLKKRRALYIGRKYTHVEPFSISKQTPANISKQE